ncbi:hypothetical protein BKA81DRAFT_140088 [Phyllosticta paracitricarpa]
MRRRRTMVTRRGDERKDAGIKDPKETDDIEIISANQTSPSFPRSLLHTQPGFPAAPHQRAGQAEPGWPGQRSTLHCAAPKRLQRPLYERNALLHARASGNSGVRQWLIDQSLARKNLGKNAKAKVKVPRTRKERHARWTGSKKFNLINGMEKAGQSWIGC